ncbi:MAG TPA: iron-sulfur cluster assembly accessory protein [Puia sp.]|jgi:iron-sulfur cluster assembly accessory protein|nr:iron-sulfur cluster assembly accessory protein [Puia sp.]
METILESPLQFSPSAVKEIRRLMDEPGFDNGNFLRIGVKGGGCSGLSYILGFDKRQEADQLFESNSLSFIMNPSHNIYLSGMMVHWEDGLNARGFSFNNPNASKTCGCGTSFAV